MRVVLAAALLLAAGAPPARMACWMPWLCAPEPSDIACMTFSQLAPPRAAAAHCLPLPCMCPCIFSAASAAASIQTRPETPLQQPAAAPPAPTGYRCTEAAQPASPTPMPFASPAPLSPAPRSPAPLSPAPLSPAPLSPAASPLPLPAGAPLPSVPAASDVFDTPAAFSGPVVGCSKCSDDKRRCLECWSRYGPGAETGECVPVRGYDGPLPCLPCLLRPCPALPHQLPVRTRPCHSVRWWDAPTAATTAKPAGSARTGWARPTAPASPASTTPAFAASEPMSRGGREWGWTSASRGPPAN